ncbi:MAG: hypothetical protein KJ914_13790 [Gammaproteobacteria bacterium]|nr:hypothetical protein [Gammaproteobacteria bacterium]MBU1723837.1 hypothetical protein [Gammaproteobacteria bacterium]MBU2004483.1 hypothetical protein [Gammaproteobacteria bacterium]
MKHSDFQIGTEFFTASGKWRCTDVGTRVIVAISLEPRETVRLWMDTKGERVQETFISDDPRDLIGPPYSVAESVFDEYDLDGCSTCVDDFADKAITADVVAAEAHFQERVECGRGNTERGLELLRKAMSE